MSEHGQNGRGERRAAEPKPVAGRVPPHNLDAEAMVLSAEILGGSDAVDEIRTILGADDPYSGANKHIQSAIYECRDRGNPVDIGTVADILRERQKLAEVGGPSYLAQIADASPAVAHAPAHARIVHDLARERKVIATCQRIAAEGYFDHGPTQPWIEAAVAAIDEIAAPSVEREGVWAGQAMAEAMSSLQAGIARGGLTGFSTGIRKLDQKTGGLERGDVTIVGGRPGMAKTALGWQMAESVAEQQRDGWQLGAAIFTLEMPRVQYLQRAAFTRAQVDRSPLKLGKDIGAEAWGRLNQAANDIRGMPIWIDDTSALSPIALRARARRINTEMRKRGVRLTLIVVDYLQLMNGRAMVPRGASREQEVAECSKAMKSIAKDIAKDIGGVHVVALSQINRSVETRGTKDRRPRISDLRESGSVEQDADNVLLLYREEYYEPETDQKGVGEIIIGKQRNGQAGVTVMASFADWCTRWGDLSSSWGDSDGPPQEDRRAPAEGTDATAPAAGWDPRQGPEG